MVFVDKDDAVQKIENSSQIKRLLEYLPGWKQCYNRSWEHVADVKRIQAIDVYHS